MILTAVQVGPSYGIPKNPRNVQQLNFHLHNHTPTQWGIALSLTAQSVQNILKVVVNDIYCIYSESGRFYNEIPSI